MLAALRAVSVYVDWGTVTDSEGTKFQTYFASFVPGPLKYHTLALVTTDISKDAQHGALMLREILDPNRDPLEEGRSILQRFFPDQSAWIFIHGDTGNGYRSYEVRICKILLVLLESRRCWPTCRRSSRILVCELCKQSLCPRHAENISDRAQAIANTLIESSKDRGSVIGLKAIVAVLREGPLQHTMRTHLAAVCFGSASVELAMCRRWQGSIWPQPQALDDSFGAGVHQQGHAPRAKVQASVHPPSDIRTGNDGRFEVA